MRWLSSPKVRLALIVNGIYFISLLTPTTPHTRPRFFARPGERREARVPARRTPPTYPPPAPPSLEPSKAEVNYVKQFDQLDVFLSHDLELVRKPGRLLLFSPTYTTRMSAPEQPRTILLRFVSFSNEQLYSEKTPLLISTNGVYRWDDTADVAYGPRSKTGRHSVTFDGGRVVETVGVELPYETFLDVISARQIVIELGGDTVALHADQIEALRSMHRRLPQGLEDLPPPPDKTGRPGGGAGRAPVIIQAPPAVAPPDRR